MTNNKGIMAGLKTQNHDQSITPVSLSIINKIVRKLDKLNPLLLSFIHSP